MLTAGFKRFFAGESAGGAVLGVAALAALIICHSPWSEVYDRWLAWPGELRIGRDALVLSKPLVVWVNDLWMAIFFFLVGLEIKREFVEGELADRRQALLPVLAAFGGMAVPALFYAVINAGGGDALRGWAIPSATDIAFAIGVLVLLGSRVPTSLKVFLTAVAIIDDLGAIVIIALFYTEQLSLPMLGGAAVGVALLVALNRSGVTRVDVYAVVGALIWLCVLKSGVHATLAGVITALAVPMRRPDGSSPVQETEHALHPWVSFLILPVFAFSNAGVSLQGADLQTLLQPVTLGIVAGLVLGKPIGVWAATEAAVALGWAARPRGASRLQLLGVAQLCGIGFTMSLFIGGLAFETVAPDLIRQVKIGVLGGSVLSALLGCALLVVASRGAPRRAP